MVSEPIRVYNRKPRNNDQKLLAIGSIMSFADEGDVVWGSGVNGKLLSRSSYNFRQLDVRAVRGPLTRDFLKALAGIDVPEIYGDPGLLVPRLFPEFKKKTKPSRPYLIIPHYSETALFPKSKYSNMISPTESWDKVIEAITDSEFVISSSLHGIVIAEAFGVPARLLRVTETEPLFKYQDYYLGTNRKSFQYARSIEEALKLGGEPSFDCDLDQLYKAFPFEFWPATT